MSQKRRVRYVEDPSIAAAARVEAAEMFDELCRLYVEGEPFFLAREKVIAKHRLRIARECGKETAKRAVAAINSLSPDNMPGHIKRAARDRMLAEIEQRHVDHYGPGYRYTGYQRWWFRETGTVGPPRRPFWPWLTGKLPTLAGEELAAWRAQAARRRSAEVRAELEAEEAEAKAEAQRGAKERAEEKEMEAFLRRATKRIERGDVPPKVPEEEQDVRAFLRGEKPLVGRRKKR